LLEIEERYRFCPIKGNVLFSSAYDGWAFTLEDFVQLQAKALGAKPEALRKCLWGNFYFNQKTSKITNKPVNDEHKPMFVSFILQNVFRVYDIVASKDEA
jgi:ribosome assembly protein 1